jgi:hypothetical protein
MKECGYGVHFVRPDPVVESTVCVQARPLSRVTCLTFYSLVVPPYTLLVLISTRPSHVSLTLSCPFFHASITTPARLSTTTSSKPNGSKSYILRGTAILQHIDSSLQHITSSPTLAPTNAPNTPIPWTTGNPNLDVVETELKSGDFVGWPAGLQSASWAHGLRAGPTGVEYLMGGSREKFDICVSIS